MPVWTNPDRLMEGLWWVEQVDRLMEDLLWVEQVDSWWKVSHWLNKLTVDGRSVNGWTSWQLMEGVCCFEQVDRVMEDILWFEQVDGWWKVCGRLNRLMEDLLWFEQVDRLMEGLFRCEQVVRNKHMGCNTLFLFVLFIPVDHTRSDITAVVDWV